MNPILNQLH